MLLITPVFRKPLVHFPVLFLERLLELLTRMVHWIGGLPVCVAVTEHLVHVGEELLVGGIALGVHLGLHGGEIHGLLDLIKVVRYRIDDGVDWFLEWADKTSPETCGSLAL